MRPHLITKAKRLLHNHMNEEAAKILRMEITQHVIDIFMMDGQSIDVFSPYSMRSIPEIDRRSLSSTSINESDYGIVAAKMTVPSCALERAVMFKHKSSFLNLLGIDRDTATFLVMELKKEEPKKAPNIWSYFKFLFPKDEPIVPKRDGYKRNLLKNELCVELKSNKSLDINLYNNYERLEQQSNMAYVVEMEPSAIDSTVRLNDKVFHTISFSKLDAVTLLYIYALTHAGGYLSNTTR